MSVQDNSFDIFRVLIVFKSTLVKTFLFTQLGNSVSVELVPLVHLQDCISNLWSRHQVGLQNTGLPLSIFRTVKLHAINEESSHFLDSVELQEHLSNCVHIDVWVLGIEGLSNIQGILR